MLDQLDYVKLGSLAFKSEAYIESTTLTRT